MYSSNGLLPKKNLSIVIDSELYKKKYIFCNTTKIIIVCILISFAMSYFVLVLPTKQERGGTRKRSSFTLK